MGFWPAQYMGYGPQYMDFGLYNEWALADTVYGFWPMQYIGFGQYNIWALAPYNIWVLVYTIYRALAHTMYGL